jgi:hypothetical protein
MFPVYRTDARSTQCIKKTLRGASGGSALNSDLKTVFPQEMQVVIMFPNEKRLCLALANYIHGIMEIRQDEK